MNVLCSVQVRVKCRCTNPLHASLHSMVVNLSVFSFFPGDGKTVYLFSEETQLI